MNFVAPVRSVLRALDMMMRHLMTFLALTLSSTVAIGCGDDDGTAPFDAGNTSDTGSTDDAATADAGDDAAAADAGDDAATADAGDDAGPIMDAGFDVLSLEDAGALCLFNSECPDDHLCQGVGDDLSYCVPGARGTTAYGEACTASEECASGVCLEDFCTKLCDSADACEDDDLPRCHPSFGFCTPSAG